MCLRYLPVSITPGILVLYFLNDDPRHRVVACENTVSCQKVLTLPDHQANCVTPWRQQPRAGTPANPSDRGWPAGIKLCSEPPPNIKVLANGSINGAWVRTLLSIDSEEPPHAAVNAALQGNVAVPCNLQDRVVALLRERAVHNGVVGDIGVERCVCNTLEPVGVE